jgi:hypothetical protein
MTYLRHDHLPHEGEQGGQVSYDAFAHLYERLRQSYGHLRASHIVNGVDPATNYDLALWRNLGGGR